MKMKKMLLTILSLITTLTVIGQCSMSFTTINSIWCNCTGYLLASPTGTAPFDYQWSTGDTTNYIDSLCQGTYTLTITDNLGCVAIDSAIITNAQQPMTIFLSSTAASCPTCCDAVISMTVYGGCPPYMYSWFPNDPYPCPGVTYTIVVTDNCGCVVQDSITPDTVPVVVGIEEQPIHNNLTFQITDKTIEFSKSIKDLKIYDILGNLVFNYSGKEISKTDILDLETGLYILKAHSISGLELTNKIMFIK